MSPHAISSSARKAGSFSGSATTFMGGQAPTGRSAEPAASVY
jgi:hypothetical protein